MNRHNNISGTIKCMNGGEYKTRDHFSGRSLTKYSTALRDGSATRDKSGISCKDHTSGEQDEIHCQGPCNRWKARQYFSNATRKSGKFWCRMCTEWQIRSEQGEILPPPGSEITAEERDSNRDAVIQDAPTVCSNEANHSNDDNHSIISTSATIGELPTMSTYRAPLVVGDMALIPPHLRPPHLRPARSYNSYQGYPDSYQISQTASQAGGFITTGPAESARGIPFTGYGPDGQRVNMVREPSEVSAATSTRSATLPKTAVEETRSGWAKVVSVSVLFIALEIILTTPQPQRKQAPLVPEYLAEGYQDHGYDDYDGESEDEP